MAEFSPPPAVGAMAYPSPNPEPGWNRDWNHTLESRAAAAVAGIELRYAATAAAPSPSPTPPPLESHWNHQCRAELRMSPGPARLHTLTIANLQNGHPLAHAHTRTHTRTRLESRLESRAAAAAAGIELRYAAAALESI